MKKIIYLSLLFSFLTSLSMKAQIGQPWIHDPSTIAECDGKYYTFGTGSGGLISADGWTWMPGAVRPGGGAAPDVMKIGNRYLVVYGATGGGLGGGHNGRILTMWNKTLDPASPDFKYSEPIEVIASDGLEDNDAIDPGLLLDPTTGRLWVSYGTYFGYIRLIEIDPKTGKRVAGNEPIDIAIDCEATDLLYRDGWYYLLGTHGTCCDGVNSTYNIVVGRSRKVTGPYLDNVGRDMLSGGGRMVIAASERQAGPGHFGRTIIDEGCEVMSCHYEADFDRSGRSVLAIRPLLWQNGWPRAGEPLHEGTYAIISERRGYALELGVDFVRIQQEREAWWKIDPATPTKALATQQLSDVISTWPEGKTAVRCGDYMNRPHQRWTLTAVPEAGGYLSAPYFKITIDGTGRCLAATADREVESQPTFTGAASQLWRIEQLIDGTYRIMPKEIPGMRGTNTRYVLYSIADSSPTLAEYDFESDNSKWNLRQISTPQPSPLPLSYDKENTGAHFAAPTMPAPEDLPIIKDLPDPLAWSDNSGLVSSFADWERRRNEIAAQIQHYGIGEKPRVTTDQVKAQMDGDTLIVEVTVGGERLTLRSTIHYPKTGQPPYALMIGTSMLSLPKQIFDNRPVATLNFHEFQVNDYSQWKKHKDRGEHPFDRLYPALKDNGAYSEWAWGVSRLIDGLQQLGAAQTKIDTRRIGVSGCSYAGKMALYAGAFDERIALTIAQEPGGGGAAAWRVTCPQDSVENIDRTDYHWFLESQKKNFGGENVYKLPYDQHELCAMVCPRALLLLGNPDYRWLADDAMRVSAEAAHKVWEHFGIGNRMQWSIVGGHQHCQLPESQWPIVSEFIDKYLITST